MADTTKVVNKKRGEKYDVFIGRPSKWGNPFRIGKDGTREEVIEKYARWIVDQPDLIGDILPELKGKVLGCFCKPKPCHGDVLVELVHLVERLTETEQRVAKGMPPTFMGACATCGSKRLRRGKQLHMEERSHPHPVYGKIQYRKYKCEQGHVTKVYGYPELGDV